VVERRDLRSDPILTRFALDTNILAYSEGLIVTPADVKKVARSQTVIARIARSGRPCIAVQSLAELHFLLVRKARIAADDAAARAIRLAAIAELAPTDEKLFNAALELSVDHKLRIFDAIILAAAAAARCDILLSEDFQPGFTWRGTTIANPFDDATARRLAIGPD
jgi:predicted nucleic acid-binding protein